MNVSLRSLSGFIKAQGDTCFFHSTNSPESRDSSFTVLSDEEKQQILTFKKLTETNVWHLKNEPVCQRCKQLAICFLSTV